MPPKGRLEDCIELALRFLSSPWSIYKNGDYVMRQTVLRLAFLEPLRYGQNGVYGTPEFSFPFKALAGFSGQESEMVLRERIELSTSPLPRECSATELPQPFVLPLRGPGRAPAGRRIPRGTAVARPRWPWPPVRGRADTRKVRGAQEAPARFSAAAATPCPGRLAGFDWTRAAMRGKETHGRKDRDHRLRQAGAEPR